MYARIATFANDPAAVDAAIAEIRADVESGNVPPQLADARVLLLVDRASGKTLGLTLFESEQAMRAGDEALNGLRGAAGRRGSVEFYEVAVENLDLRRDEEEAR